MNNIYRIAADWLVKKRRFALAVILDARGSAPQGAGAAALFSPQALIEGTVGGGLLENAVRKKAKDALKKGHPRIMNFVLKGKSTESESPICGGEVRVLIDPCPAKSLDAFRRFKRSHEAHEEGILATSIRLLSADQVVLRRDWLAAGKLASLHPKVAGILSTGEALLVERRARKAGGESGLLFLEPLLPPARLVIAGAGHIGRAVSHLGRLLDFEVTVIDDRREFANRANLPDADRIIRSDIGQALRVFPFSPETYVVIATRGHAGDADALQACVRSKAGYIGMVGSRTKVDLMRREFLARGWATPGQIGRVRSPIGLPIRSKSVQEIAVSIAAELVLARRENREGKASRP